MTTSRPRYADVFYLHGSLNRYFIWSFSVLAAVFKVTRHLCKQPHNCFNSGLQSFKMFTTERLSEANLIAVCQVTSTSDKRANFEKCSELIRKAKSRGAQVNNNYSAHLHTSTLKQSYTKVKIMQMQKSRIDI